VDDRDGAEPLGDEDFLAVEPSPNHEVVYQPPTAPPPANDRTIETERVKIAPDPERAALAKQTTVKILSRRPREPLVTPPEVRIAYRKRSRHLFAASMAMLALAGVLGGIYIRKELMSAPREPPPQAAPTASSNPSPIVSPTPSPSTSAVQIPKALPEPDAEAAPVETASRKVVKPAPPPTTTPATTRATPRPSLTPPIGPPVF